MVPPAGGWCHSVQPWPVRPSSASKRHRARGKRAGRPSGEVTATGANASGVTVAGVPGKWSRERAGRSEASKDVSAEKPSRWPISPPGGTVKHGHGSGKPMLACMPWTKVPSSRRPDDHSHDTFHQSRSPQLWSRSPWASIVNVSPPAVTVPETVQGIS